MKTLIIVLSVFLAVNSMASAQEAVKSSQKELVKEMFACPMHPDEMSSKEGECSKCGMKLVKTLNHDTSGKGRKTEVVSKYVCTMDGEQSDKAGMCPKCGMDMTKQQGQAVNYTCSMHPNEVSSEPGKCGKCGMKMVKTTEVKRNVAVKGSQSSRKVVTKYVCTMDGEQSDKAGKCPKCGMEMTKMDNKKK